MIKLITYKNKLNYVGFKINGHAEYAEHGKDIVCAAVSILSQTCVNSVDKILKLDFDFCENQNDGMIEFIIKDFDKYEKKLQEKASLLIESMELGIKGIESLYPDYVKVTSREV